MDINSIYKSQELKTEIKSHFEENGFLQLNSFIEGDIDKIKNKLIENTNLKIKNKFISCFEIDKNITPDYELVKFLEFFKSKDFIDFLEDITGFSLAQDFINLRRYSKGDFVSIENEYNQDYLEVIFDISESVENSNLKYLVNGEEAFELEPTFNTLTFLFKSKEVDKYLEEINDDKSILRVEMGFIFIE